MKKIIIANWKMNPSSLKEAKNIFDGIKKTASGLKKVETVICPPLVYLSDLQRFNLCSSRTKVKPLLGAQNLFWENPPAGGGAYTGEISARMLEDLGVKYVIIGHSERRNPPAGGGETNEIVNKKIKTALKGGLKVVFCVGERERDSEGNHLHFIKEEISEGLKDIPKKLFNQPAGRLIVAYEPSWAISASSNAVPDNPYSVFKMIIYIRRSLLPFLGDKMARAVPILYGGSVDAKNCAGFLREGNAQGLLVGQKSLNPKEFGEILKIAEKIK